MLKRILSAILSIALLSATASMSVGAVSIDEASESDCAEIKTIKPVIKNNIATYYDENGNEVDITAENRELEVNTALPESYDLRDYGRSTSVKNQGSEGLCWDFGSTASIESNILTNPELSAQLGENAWENLDLSEAGNSWYLHTNIEDESSILYGEFIDDPSKGTDGGNSHMIAMSFSSGYGMYPEELLPYSEWNNGYPEPLRYYSDYRFKDFNVFENDNTELLKQKLMENGALAVSYNCFNSNYNDVDGWQTYYDNGEPLDGNYGQGHLVAIVGWDDDFSKEYFYPEMQPENDGAWLCKNSWGDTWGCTNEGYEGYFWMSYETDISYLAQFEVQSVDEFDNIYQNQIDSSFYAYEVVSSANVFTAKSDEKIEQICFTNTGYSDFTVEIYKLADNYSSPVDGECIASFESSVDFTGTHCIECPENIFIEKGDVFSVVITDEDGMGIGYSACESDYRNISYVLDENNNWIDVVDSYGIGRISIKAYTSNKNGAVDKDKLSQSIEIAENLEIKDFIQQDTVDEFNKQLQNAVSVLGDDSASQNTVDNTVCLLNNVVEKIENYGIVINSMDDFMDYYNKVVYEEDYSAKYIELNTDLDLSGITDFKPLYTNFAFTGIFDGKNHIISGLNIDAPDGSAGFFWKIVDAEIKNITFTDCNICADWNSAAISGISEQSNFVNCRVENSYFVSKKENAGGITCNDFESVFDNCSVSKTEIIGNVSAGVYATWNADANNCESEEVTLLSTGSITDANGFVVSYFSEDSYNKPIIKCENGKFTVEEFVGKILSIESDGATVTKNGDIYELDITSEDRADLMINYDASQPVPFTFYSDILTREIELLRYHGEESDVVFPSEIGGLPVTKINQNFRFYTTQPIKSITFSGSVKDINCLNFNSMEELESLTFEEGVERIGGNMFNYCYSLKYISLPDSLCEIGDSVFVRADSLEKVHFGNGLKKIGSAVFLACNKLRNIDLPESLEYIGDNSLVGCGATCVVLGKNIKGIGSSSIGYTNHIGIRYRRIEIPDFTVYGYAGTDAQRYAEVNEFKFVDITTQQPEITDNGFDYSVFKKGDVNLDGIVSIQDATLVQKVLAGDANLNSIQEANSLVGFYDHSITINNVTEIQKYLANLIPNLDEGFIE